MLGLFSFLMIKNIDTETCHGKLMCCLRCLCVCKALVAFFRLQVKCSTLLRTKRWLLRKQEKRVRRRTVSWPLLVSCTLPGDRGWTGVTTAGSRMEARGIPSLYPNCSVAEAWSVSGPCIAIETRLASHNHLLSLELIVLKVNVLTLYSILTMCHGNSVTC